MQPYLPVIALSLFTPAAAFGLEYVTIQQNGSQKELAGKLEVEAEDGGVMLLTADGVLWPLPKEEIVSRKSDDKPFVPLTAGEIAKKLMAELPDGFKIHQTKNYLICYNTSPAYAQWVGGLFERLNSAFYNYWTRRGIAMRQPEFPLVALVHCASFVHRHLPAPPRKIGQ